MSVAEEYRTIAGSAGWIDRGTRGRLRFDGADVLSFLQVLVTNDVSGLVEGRGAYAAYLTPQGRMIADLELYHRGSWVLGGVVPGMAGSLAATFDALVFAEDVRVTDASAAIGETLVVGGDAARLVADVTGADAAAVNALAELSQMPFERGFVARAGESLLPSYRVFSTSPVGPSPGAFRARGAIEISNDLAESLRIEAGRPRFGVDMDAETIPLEAGLLERAISTTKGCYVGQEIVIRILHRGGGRVAKRLVTLSLDRAAAVPAPLTPLVREGRGVGRITSAAMAPDGRGPIALGYVAREAAEVGGRLIVDGSGEIATITGFAR